MCTGAVLFYRDHSIPMPDTESTPLTTRALPGDLQDLLHQIEAADREADVLTAGLSDRQFHWQPDGGRAWSIAQCLDHLATANRVYGAAIATGVERARAERWQRRGPIATGIVGRWFIRSMEPPVKRRLQAPTKIRPASSLSRGEVMLAYHHAHAQIRSLIESCGDLDVNRATFVNPFLSWIKVRVGTGLRIIAAHDRRHLWQAARVKALPQFPR